MRQMGIGTPPTNWSLDVVPTVAHDVVIPNGITNTITVNTAAVCSSLTINEGGTDNIVSISSGNSLTVSIVKMNHL